MTLHKLLWLPLLWLGGMAQASPLLEAQGVESAALGGSGVAREGGPQSVLLNPALAVGRRGLAVQVGGAGVLEWHVAHGRNDAGPAGVLGVDRTRLSLGTPPMVAAVLSQSGWALGVTLGAPVQWDASWERAGGFTWRVVELGAVAAVGTQHLKAGVSLLGNVAAQGEVQHVGLGGRAQAGVVLTPWTGVSVGASWKTRSLMVEREAAAAGPLLEKMGTWMLPDQGQLGVVWRMVPATRFTLDAAVTLWSSVQGWMLPQVAWRDSVGVKAGVEQLLPWVASDLCVRAGFHASTSPVQRASRDAPFGDTVGGALGVGWQLWGLKLDAAYTATVTLPGPLDSGDGTLQHRATQHAVWLAAAYRLPI